MNKLIKKYINSSLDFYRQYKNLSKEFNEEVKELVNRMKPTNYLPLRITDFDPLNSEFWSFDYELGMMINDTGEFKDLITKPIHLNDFKIKKIVLKGTNVSTAVISYTIEDLEEDNWITIASGDNDDLDLIIDAVAEDGIRFKITNDDCNIVKLFVLHELL